MFGLTLLFFCSLLSQGVSTFSVVLRGALYFRLSTQPQPAAPQGPLHLPTWHIWQRLTWCDYAGDYHLHLMQSVLDSVL